MFGKSWVADNFGESKASYDSWAGRLSVGRQRVTPHDTLEFITQHTEQAASASDAICCILGNKNSVTTFAKMRVIEQCKGHSSVTYNAVGVGVSHFHEKGVTKMYGSMSLPL